MIPMTIDATTLRQHLQFEDLIEPVAQAFVQTSMKEADNGLIMMYPSARPDLGDIMVKTGVLQGHKVCIVKVAPWFAVNTQVGKSQGGFLAVFDSDTGQTLALIHDEHYLSDIRTAAAGAVVARYLVLPQVKTATVIGSGTQAYWQALALYHVRPYGRLMIWARDAAKAEALKTKLAGRLTEVLINIAIDLEFSVRAADVIITATLSREPLVRGAWLKPGQHITAVGADDPSKCELDAQALSRAKVYVDAAETALANGDVYRAILSGNYSEQLLAGEIGDVVCGRLAGRASDTDITVAKLVGLGAQDVAAAEVVMAKLLLSL